MQFEVFNQIYEQNIWGNNHNQYYKGSSGGGSELSFNADTYIPFLKNFLNTYSINSVTDLGCGDFVCGPDIYADTSIIYRGYDIYNKVILHHQDMYKNNTLWYFECLDFYNNIDKIQNSDLCILKDVVQHWKNEYIYHFLDDVIARKKFKYILLCNCCNQHYDNEDIDANGGGRSLSCTKLPLKSIIRHYYIPIIQKRFLLFLFK
jgi:hypothetical protein